jgi:uncharacterized membrane protein
VTPLPAGVPEGVLAPAVLVLAFVHAHRALGSSRALLEVGALTAYGYALEAVGIAVFHAHEYGPRWRLAPGGVPLAVAAVWAAAILAALTVAARRGLRTPGARAVAAALVAISLDLLIEPAAVRRGLWRWTPPGAWLGAPLGNFVGWGVIVTAWCAGVERERPGGSLARAAARRAALGAASIAALVVVGTAWRAAGLERALGTTTAAAVAASVWLAALVVTARRHAPPAWPDTLAGRLGATPGLAPEAVLGLLAAGFAWDAFASGERAVQAVAAAAVVVVAWVAAASARFGLGDAWRGRALGRFGGVQDFVRVLMKPPNGEPWTADDRRRLRGELRALARWTPGFVLFLLPGGMLLLVVYAHLLDRRRVLRSAAREGTQRTQSR